MEWHEAMGIECSGDEGSGTMMGGEDTLHKGFCMFFVSLLILFLMFIPICSMYGLFTYIWVIFRAHVGEYSMHGAYGDYFR